MLIDHLSPSPPPRRSGVVSGVTSDVQQQEEDEDKSEEDAASSDDDSSQEATVVTKKKNKGRGKTPNWRSSEIIALIDSIEAVLEELQKPDTYRGSISHCRKRVT